MSSDRRIRLVIFDLDGTLVDAYQAVEKSLNFTLLRLGYPSESGARIKRSVGWGETHLLSQFVRPADLASAVKIYKRHHPQALQQGTKYLPGAKTVLRQLKQKGYLLAVASNRATRFTRIIVRQLKAEKFFDFILCRDKVARPKPYPDILKGILKKFFLKPHQAIFVGDMVVDIQAGRRAKVKTVAVITGSSTARELREAKPGHFIKKITEVRRLVEESNLLFKRSKA